MASPATIPDFVKVMEKLRSECSGACNGIGIGVDIHWGACPEPCDPKIMDPVILSAKTKAKDMSQEDCKGKNCFCVGDYNEVFRPQCIAVEGWCVYVAAYYYGGDCVKWF